MTNASSRLFGLSKSKITMFEQCPKRLWLATHQSELAEYDGGANARFANGHEVGAIACSLVPTGIMVEAEPDLAAALTKTGELLQLRPRKPIFEATLQHNGVLVRIDILEPANDGSWKIIEVKSSGSAKDYHLGDLATQIWVARQCGLTISSACIRHIDTRFVLERQGDYSGLLVDTELLDAVGRIVESRGDQVVEARAILNGAQPVIECGDHCTQPFVCEFTTHCHATLPAGPEWPVDILPRGGGKALREQGIDDLLKVDASQLKNPIHLRVHQATVSGEIFHDKRGARAATREWSYPRTWLDFETIAFAVPRWVGTRPYQQVPFQFSAHVETSDGSIEHHEFLSLDGADPRRACAEALVQSIPGKGAVIAYNASFERGQIVALANIFPGLAPQLNDIASRIVDLLPVARDHWYHRDQRGSWSIKAVLPTVCKLDYFSLEVSDGAGAQQAYLRAICPDCNSEERNAIALALKAYCQRDTWAMIEVARKII